MTPPTERMLHSDAFAWYMEKDPVLRSTIVAVHRLESEPDWSRLRARIDRLTQLVPRLQMWVRPRALRLGPPRWTVDEDFDLDYHLRRIRVSGSLDWAEVLEFARRAAMADFDRTRPLWEFTLLEGLDGGGAAFITKLHHSLTDGIGGMQLAALVVDLGPDPVEGVQPAAAPPPPRATGRADRDPAERRSVLRTVRSVSRFVAPVSRPYSNLLGSRSTKRYVATLDVPFAALHDSAAAAGAHLNDAFLAALVDGMQRYHEKHGAALEHVRVTVPVSIRTDDDGIGGNRITLTRVTLPADISSAVVRMRRVRDIMTGWRHEPALAHTQRIARGLNFMPRSYLNGVLKRVEMVGSDVPGVPVPLWLAGARITGFYAFGPTIGAAVNATLMSYAGTCFIGLNLDTRAIEEPELWLQCLEEALADVLVAGSAEG